MTIADLCKGALRHQLAIYLPGLGVVVAMTATAMLLQRATGIAALSPLIVALLLGIGWRSFAGSRPVLKPGIRFALKPALRMAIVLLGIQVTLDEVAALGIRGGVAVVITLIASFLFTCLLGRLIGVEQRLTRLIAAGTSVCGASAVMACNTVIRGSEEDVAYAIACVTLFGTTAMLLGPVAAVALGLAPETYGLWAGTTIHEVAQVAGAAFALGDEAGHAGMVAKLTRVMLLAPLILTLGALKRDDGNDGTRLPVPWFAFGFIGMMLLNSLIALPPALYEMLVMLTTIMLTCALAAMGVETDLRKIRLKGIRPLLLGASAWAFIATIGLTLTLWAVNQ